MQLALDHIVVAVADLETASDDFAMTTGCRPMAGGPHPGLGTCNALVSFGSGGYLEIIAPDPAQEQTTPLAARLSRLEAPELFHWALRVDDLALVAADLRETGLEPTPSIETRRQLPSGETLVWNLMGLPGRGGAWPFFIDWGDCVHPSKEAPMVGEITEFCVSLPDVSRTAIPFSSASGVTFLEGPPALSLRIETGQGVIHWRQRSPVGFFS